MRDMASFDELLEQVELRDCVLSGIDIDIYVSDISSHEILYTNMEPRRDGNGGRLVGRICWESLHGRSKKCEPCPITYLLKNPGKRLRQEIRHEYRSTLICDSLIPWLRGRLAHLHYSLDLCE